MPLEFPPIVMIETGIVTDNIEPMVSFYKEVLGLPFLEEVRYPGGSQHRFSCGTAIVKILRFDVPPTVGLPPGGPSGGAKGVRYLTFKIQNVRQIVEEVRAAGYGVPQEPFQFAPDLMVAFVQDPDGNWIELYGR